MDLHGQRAFVDLEGEKLPEATIAIGSEVFGVPGYAAPPLFNAAYQYVIDKGYDRGSFKSWAQKKGLI